MKNSNYTKLKILKLSKPYYKTKIVEFDNKFNVEKYLNKNSTEKAIDTCIKAASIKYNTNVDLPLMLRCKISHSIFNTVKSFYLKGVNNNLDWDILEILELFLEDDGERIFKSDNFNYLFLENKHNTDSKNNIFPFSGEIIYSYDHLNSTNISTWSKIRVLGDNRLKKLLHPHGVLISKSPYTLLKDTPNSTTTKAWVKYGDNSLTSKILDQLLTSYKESYPARKKRGWIPDSYFLSQLTPSQKDTDLLLKIAGCITQYKWVTFKTSEKFREKDEESNKNTRIIEFVTDEKGNEEYLNNYDPSSFELYILKIIRKYTKELLCSKIKNYYSQKNKYPERIKAFILFSQIDTSQKYDKLEFVNIAKGCKNINGDSLLLPLLSKIFGFSTISNNVIKLTIDKLKEMTIECINDPKKFIEKYEKNKNYELYLDEIKIFKSFYLKKDIFSWGGFEHITKFDKPEYIKNISLIIDKYINPRKIRKVFLISIVREIIQELNIS